MLLLDKDKISTNSVSIRKISIISDRDEVSNQIAQVLRTRGLENVELLNINFLDEDNKRFNFSAEDTLGIIVDIEDSSNVEEVLAFTRRVVPQHVWCCLVGDSDSISLSQKFTQEKLPYFHLDSQLYQMVERVLSGEQIPTARQTVKINILSCKGGVGASLISAHIANMISTEKKVPVLFIQGDSGSHTIDLFFDKKVKNEVVEITNNLHIFYGNASQLKEEIIHRYNFVISDIPIFNVHKEQFSDLIHKGDCFVLVTDRYIGSLRVAKNFLAECDRLRSMENRFIRNFVCISDHRQELSKAISKYDLESLLGVNIDAIIPFLKHANPKKILDLKLPKDAQKELKNLTFSVIGLSSRKTRTHKKQSWFSKLLSGK